jgi:hypothetical protein
VVVIYAAPIVVSGANQCEATSRCTTPINAAAAATDSGMRRICNYAADAGNGPVAVSTVDERNSSSRCRRRRRHRALATATMMTGTAKKIVNSRVTIVRSRSMRSVNANPIHAARRAVM